MNTVKMAGDSCSLLLNKDNLKLMWLDDLCCIILKNIVLNRPLSICSETIFLYLANNLSTCLICYLFEEHCQGGMQAGDSCCYLLNNNN